MLLRGLAWTSWQQLCKYPTLYTGNVLRMGAQCAAGDMLPDDTIGVEVSGIGVLQNQVGAKE